MFTPDDLSTCLLPMYLSFFPSSQVTPTHLPQSNVTKVANVVPVGLLAASPTRHPGKIFLVPFIVIQRVSKKELVEWKQIFDFGFQPTKANQISWNVEKFWADMQVQDVHWITVGCWKYTYFGHKCKPIRPTHGGISLFGQTVNMWILLPTTVFLSHPFVLDWVRTEKTTHQRHETHLNFGKV